MFIVLLSTQTINKFDNGNEKNTWSATETHSKI